MPNNDNFWVSQRPNGQWAVQREGGEKASGLFDTQAEAWDRAKKLSRGNRGEAFLKGIDNRIRERNSYGNDPYPPKG